MNPQNPNLQKSNLKIATTDLVLMALFASLGLATKNVIHPLVATITGPLYVPTGAVANGVFDYVGVQLKTLLEQTKTSANSTSVYLQASDGYGSAIPIQDALNENTIIAYKRNGSALTLLKDNGEGPLRLIIGNGAVRAKVD